MDNIVYKFQGTDEVFTASESFAVGRSSLFDVDVSRMRKVMESPSVQMPQGLTREQKRALILSYASAA
jgi:hypothetical protein